MPHDSCLQSQMSFQSCLVHLQSLNLHVTRCSPACRAAICAPPSTTTPLASSNGAPRAGHSSVLIDCALRHHVKHATSSRADTSARVVNSGFRASMSLSPVLRAAWRSAASVKGLACVSAQEQEGIQLGVGHDQGHPLPALPQRLVTVPMVAFLTLRWMRSM